MNSDDDVDSLNPACRRPNLIVVNHHGASREQPPATANQIPAGEASGVEDEVVETSDNEELALDLALQRPSYWLAPSLYPPLLQTTDPGRPCFSQQAVESSSAQPSPQPHSSPLQTTSVPSALSPSRTSSLANSPAPEPSSNTWGGDVDLWGYGQPPGVLDNEALDSMNIQTMNNTVEVPLQFPSSPSSKPSIMILSSQTPPLALAGNTSSEAMEVDGSSTDEAVVQAILRFPSTGSVEVSQKTRHQHYQNRTVTPSRLTIDLTTSDPFDILHLNSPLSPTTPPATSILGKRKRSSPSPSPSQFRLESRPQYVRAEPSGSNSFGEDDEALAKTTQAAEVADGGRRYSLRKRDGEFHPYTDYLRMWGREGKKLLENLDKMERKKKRARFDGSVSDDEEEYHQETQEESQTQLPHLHRSRAKSMEPQHRPKETEKGSSKGHRHHPRPLDSPLYRPRAWVPPSPPRNPAKPVQEPIRRPNPQHDLLNKPRRFILDDGSPVRGRVAEPSKVTMPPFPSRKGDTSDEGEPLAREKSDHHRGVTQLVLQMGDADSSEPDFDFNQPIADRNDELDSVPPRKRASNRMVQPHSDPDKTESESSSASETSPKAGVALALEQEMAKWSKEDHKRFAILKRTMPTTMCLKLMREAMEAERRKREEARLKALVESDEDGDEGNEEDEESQDVRPGHSKIRHGGGRNVAIVGDTESESEDDQRAVGGSHNFVADNSDVELLDDAVPEDLDEDQSLAPPHSRASRSVSVRGAETAVEDNNGSDEDSGSEVEFLGESIEDNRVHGGYRVGMSKPRRMVQTRIDRMLSSATPRKSGGPARKQSKKRVSVNDRVGSHSRKEVRRDLGGGFAQSGRPYGRSTNYSMPRITHGGDEDGRIRKHKSYHSTSEGANLTIEFGPVRHGTKRPPQSSSSHQKRPTEKRATYYQQDLLRCLTGRDPHQNQIHIAPQDPETESVAPAVKKPSTKHARRRAARSANIHIFEGGSSLRSKPISTHRYQTIEDPPLPTRNDPDSSIHIARDSAKTFGMPRHLKDFSLPRDSFVSQGRLLDLVKVLSGVRDPPRPDDCFISGLHLRAEMSLDDLQLSLPACFDLLCEYALAGLEVHREVLEDPPEISLLEFLCGYTSWVARQGVVAEVKALFEHLSQQLRQTMDRLEDKLDLQAVYGSDFNEGLWKVHWFAVELTARMVYGGCAARRTTGGQLVVKAKELDEEVERLMARLHEFGIQRMARAFKHDREKPTSKATRAMELWVALIHTTLLLPSDPNTEKEACTTFWRCVERSLETTARVFPSPIHESEYGWSTIFGLSAISQIDVRGQANDNSIRLQAHWPLACKCMARIQLAPNPEADKRLSRHVLHDRDIYVGILFTRCHALVAKWEWSLVDSDNLFAVLREALRHRNFENLGHESNEFPQFILAKDLALLDSYNSFDSIQTVAIKLIVGHAKASPQGIKSAVKGLSSFASTNANATIFTKEKPPIRKELSRVFNRFTISFMMLHVDHSVQRARSIVTNAKRFVDFRNADLESRKASIRASMAFGLLLRYHDLPMDEVVRWMNEMGGAIMNDYSALGRSVAKRELQQIEVLCGMLLGCSRLIAVDRGFAGDDEPVDVRYPTSSLFLTDFLAKLFKAHELLNLLSRDILAYLEAWLDQRERLIPPPSVPQFHTNVPPLQEESQEDYGFDPIDFDDPLLNAALQGDTERGAPVSSGLYFAADKDLAEKLLQHVPSIYQLVSRLAFMDGTQMDEATLNAWLDCWARLGGFVVRHRLRDWSYFLQQGPAALDRIGDRKWRRRASPRFLLSVLKTDPNSYKEHRRLFFQVWLSSLVATRISHEHEFTYWMFHIDGFRHPLLHAVPFDKSMSEDEYGRDAFVANRLGIIEAVVKNLANRLEMQKEAHCTAETVNENTEGLIAIEEMLQSVADHYTDLLPGFVKDEYGSLCRKILAAIEINGTLVEDTRIASSLSWFKALR